MCLEDDRVVGGCCIVELRGGVTAVGLVGTLAGRKLVLQAKGRNAWRKAQLWQSTFTALRFVALP